MSRDQRPGKIRIIAEPPKPAAPDRRASDGAQAVALAQPSAPAAPASRFPLMLAALFLLCCVAGAVAVTLVLGIEP